MSMPLLPAWLQLAWVLVLCAVLGVHAVHALLVVGEARWWHAAHITMALGMAVMYLLPQDTHPGPYRAGVVVFGTAAAAAAITAAALRGRGRGTGWRWAGAASELLAMAYMALPHAQRPAATTYLLVAYLAAEACVWLAGPLHGIRAPQLGAARVIARVGAAGPAITATARPAADTQPGGALDQLSAGVRATLAAMTASMIWMLIAMASAPAMSAPMMPGH